jgi:hypothetical protein
MIDMKSTQGKGCAPKDGVHRPRDKRLMGAWALDGCTRSTEGHNELVECGFTKGHDTPKRHMFHTSDPWSSYKSKGTQPRGGIEHFWQEIWRASLRQVCDNKLR